MNLVRSLVAAAALATLAACAATPTPEPFVRPDTPAPSPAPAPIPGYDWHLYISGGEAGLAYGVADSDDVRLSLHCISGSNDLMLYKDVEDGAAPVIHLESGGETERFPADAEPSELTGGDILSATAPADHPVFQRFRRVGWLASWVGDRREPYAAHPGSESAVERFFTACN